MKKLTLCLVITAFAFTPALLAGDTKTKATAKAKAVSAEKATCSDSAKTACCADEKALTKKKTTQSPKGALLAKR